eukprot:1535266-Lingulodinium_polyedra.AAC.1
MAARALTERSERCLGAATEHGVQPYLRAPLPATTSRVLTTPNERCLDATTGHGVQPHLLAPCACHDRA